MEDDSISLTRRNILLGGAAATGIAGMALPAAVLASTPTAESCSCAQIFNILDYGAEPIPDMAVPHVSVDCTAAINAAVADAASSNGGIVYVPKGSFRITSSIVISSNNIQIAGDGKGISRLYGHGVNGPMISFNSAYTDPQIVDCGVQGIMLHGTSVPKAGDYGIALYNTSKLTLRDIYFAANLHHSSLLICNSWIVHCYDLHLVGNCSTAQIHIHRPSPNADSSNALMFFGTNLLANGTPTGILMESDVTGNGVGDVFVFHGLTCQGFNRALFLRHGSSIDVTGYYGEANTTDFHLGDNSDQSAFVHGVRINSWNIKLAQTGFLLDQCCDVTIGNGMFTSVTKPFVLGEITGGLIQSGKSMLNQIYYAPNKRTRTGVMVIEGDNHQAPEWPTTATAMGIVLRADSNTAGKHYKITVNDTGSLVTTPVVFPNA